MLNTEQGLARLLGQLAEFHADDIEAILGQLSPSGAARARSLLAEFELDQVGSSTEDKVDLSPWLAERVACGDTIGMTPRALEALRRAAGSARSAHQPRTTTSLVARVTAALLGRRMAA